jgi:Na+/proline symporter
MGDWNPIYLLLIIAAYFGVLMLISWWTSRGADNQTFFIGNRESPWYLVAFGMIGASLSGVTFISVPGWVKSSQFSYMQMVMGYMLGYLFIATVLMPLYYRLNLTSIYTYLKQRFGENSHKTGSAFFLISRTIGASFRLYLVAIILQNFVFKQLGWNMPFVATVGITIALIWIYTFRGGIKTIVWTDSLQTFFMLSAVIISLIFIGRELGLGPGEIVQTVKQSDYSQVFFFEGGWSDPRNFFKQFVAGALIAIVMTGLDQDMMQKNLSCRNIGEAQKNMLWFSLSLLIVNLIFLSLGALLYLYMSQNGIDVPVMEIAGQQKPSADLIFAEVAINHLPAIGGIVFLLGLTAAAYSSADSALTALTTSFCVDFLGMDEKNGNTQTRTGVHIAFSILLLIVIVIFRELDDGKGVIDAVFRTAGYTYGPLLGLYAFGLFMKRGLKDRFVPLVCVAAPILTYIVNENSEAWFNDYKFGFELLLLNGLATFLGLLLISKGNKTSPQPASVVDAAVYKRIWQRE